MWIVIIIIFLVVCFFVIGAKQNKAWEIEQARLKSLIDQGSIQALYDLGMLYKKKGQDNLAFLWLEKAAAQGHSEGIFAANDLKNKIREKDEAERIRKAKEEERWRKEGKCYFCGGEMVYWNITHYSYKDRYCKKCRKHRSGGIVTPP